MERSSWPVPMLFRSTKWCGNILQLTRIAALLSQTNKPATSARHWKSGALFQQARTRYSVLYILRTGLSAPPHSTEPAYQKPNLTQNPHTHHDETHPNFKTRRYTAFGLRTYYLRTAYHHRRKLRDSC